VCRKVAYLRLHEAEKMSTQIGRFEILSEIVKSARGAIYKANDSSSNQVVALKTVHLDMSEDEAKAFGDRVLAEVDSAKALTSQNAALLYGAGQIDDQFCAAMEYVQGNSIATMLARHEGFSIWDLLDISRQMCAGLDHAAASGVVHHSLEPDKVMVQWDGLVKILGYGISTMSFASPDGSSVPKRNTYYQSPEQVQGSAVDIRSNLFSWGAILYEMVTDRKAFDGETSQAVLHAIVHENPVAPCQVNPKIQPAVSALIMKALAKTPEERYQSGRELLDDLEKCKENKSSATKPAVPPRAPAALNQAAASAKFTNTVQAKPSPAVAAPRSAKAAEQQEQGGSETNANQATGGSHVAPQAPSDNRQFVRAAAAAASSTSASRRTFTQPAELESAPDATQSFVSSVTKESLEAFHSAAQMSAAPAEAEAPHIAVDPMMAAMESGSAAPTKSFSDLDELPPLKQTYTAPKPEVIHEEPEPEPVPIALRPKQEKPKVQPRVVAEKAIKEIKTVPPKLMAYSVMGAVILIVVIALGVTWRMYSQNSDDDSKPVRKSAASVQTAAPTPAPQPVAEPEQQEQQAVAEPDVVQIPIKHKGKKAAPAPVAVAVVPGVLALDSTPEGAQVQIDGRGDPGWVTPFSLPGVAPGQHTVSVLKQGYTTETRAVDVSAGSKSFVVVHLSPMGATVAVTSQPAGASVFIDGKDTGHVTPATLNVEKGTHTVLVRKPGFLDETTTTDMVAGQTVHVSPTLRALGNVDDIKTVGKFKKLFGGGGDSTAGMGTVAIKTQPKGAQIAINRRILDKPSPSEFMLGPGNYIVDITLTGFKSIHKVITVEKGGKVAIDEILERE
jgi:serine/threonine-protein kinase